MFFDGTDTGTRITNTLIVGGINLDPDGPQCRDNYDEDLANVDC